MKKTVKPKVGIVEKRLANIEEQLAKLDKEIDMTQKIIHVEVVTNALHVKQELSKEVQKLHNEQSNKLDFIVKELENLREDRILGVHQTREIREQVDNHEKRIARLEHP